MTFAAMGFENKVTEKSADPSIDGYDGIYKGLPYNIHPTGTPEQYNALMTAIENNDVTVIAYSAPQITAEEALRAKHEAIDALRDAKIKEGVPYVFPDSTAGTIQTRDEKDFRNITGIATMGIITAGQAITIPFRDQEDVSHSLTPEQAVSLGVAVTNATAEIYKAAWAHKDALSLLTTAEIEAYDITVNWP